ncbi:serine hydroxymethyltransferase, partial [Escherichia coli]
EPGDTVLGMHLAHGGPLPHGSPVNFTGTRYNIVPSGIDATGPIDYAALDLRAQDPTGHMIVGGFCAGAGVVAGATWGG